MTSGQAGFVGYAPVLIPGTGNPEAEKYGKMWERPEYRITSPGESLVYTFISIATPRHGARCIDFGCGTGRAAVSLAMQSGLHVTMVDFVRNSLDPEVRGLLATPGTRLTFLKADLEKPLPVEPAEYGYCTDVLEHIPPDRVDAVLDNILRAAKHVFFSISCGEDQCGALIGEPLHLTIQPPAWWIEQLKLRGCAIHWSHENNRGVLIYATLWESAQMAVEAGEVNTTTEAIQANVRSNCAGEWAQVIPCATQDTEVMIVGGGPSLRHFVDDIRQKRAEGVKLVTLNGAYNWAIAHGLAPSATIIVDAREFNNRFVKPVLPECKYLMASQVHPSVLEGLPRDRTLLWHVMGEATKAIVDAAYPVNWPVPGGCTVLLRAIPLLRQLGYHRFHLYGCDSCLEDNAHHAYAQPENDSEVVVPIMVTGGRVFRCHPWQAAQAQEFVTLVKNIGELFDLQVHGDGLLSHIITTGAELSPAQEGED